MRLWCGKIWWDNIQILLMPPVHVCALADVIQRESDSSLVATAAATVAVGAIGARGTVLGLIAVAVAVVPARVVISTAVGGISPGVAVLRHVALAVVGTPAGVAAASTATVFVRCQAVAEVAIVRGRRQLPKSKGPTRDCPDRDGVPASLNIVVRKTHGPGSGWRANWWR